MLLVLDIGNTNITIGIYDEDKLTKVWRIASDMLKTSDEYGIVLSSLLNMKDSKIESAIISSVVPLLEDTIKTAVEEYLNVPVYIVSYKSKLPFEIKIDNPSEIGADRIANAAAAVSLYKLPVIVIDIGTATTFDIVDKNANFIGGIIAPGPKIQAASLNSATSKLPKLKIEAPKTIIGKNTVDAMLSGIVKGHEMMVSGMLELCKKELNDCPIVVATGGFSQVLFNEENSIFDYVNKDLTLFGLKNIWKMNRGS